jgi:hypothetical protein
MAQKKSKAKPAAKPAKPAKPPKARNPFVEDAEHMGEMTVRQLVELVGTPEFPKGLDTRICIGDVEGNLGVNATVMVTAHRPEDVVLSIDEHGGDMGYCDRLLPEAD